METKWTPGPWSYRKARSGKDRWWVEAPKDDDGAVWYLAECAVPSRGPWNEANSRLIAAAPDLAEALEALLVGCRYLGGPSGDVLAAARAALAKARGES